MSKEVVMYDSPEAAQLKTVTGWVSRDGLFYGENEHLARYSGSTHKRCNCGKVFAKGHTMCSSCEAARRTAKYYNLPVKEWDSKTPISLFDSDQFFFDEDSFLDYLADLKHSEPDMEHEVQAVLCTPGKLGLVSEDNWTDDLPEDGELPDAVALKVQELNEAIKAAGPVCWWPGNVRIDMDKVWAKLAEAEEAVQA